MTILRNSQLAHIGVINNPAATSLRNSQLAYIAVASNPAAAELRLSQFAMVIVAANGSLTQQLGPVVRLGCWTPCGTLAFNHGA